MRTFTKIAVYLLMLNFLSENMGSFTHELNDFFALSLLAAFLLMHFPIKLKRVKLSKNLESLLLFAISAFIFKQGGIYKPIAASIFVLTLNHLLRSHDREEPDLYVLYLTTLFYTIFLFAYEYIPYVWLTSQEISKFVSINISSIMPYRVDYGTTYLGSRITVSVAVFCLVALFFSENRRIVRFVFLLISLIIVNIIYVILITYMIVKTENLYPTLFIKLLDGQIILFLLLLPPIYIYLRRVSLNNYSLSSSPKNSNYLMLMMLIVIVPLLSISDFRSFSLLPTKPGKIVFYNEGHVDWSVPIFGKYGGKKGGMFGLLLQHLRAKHYEVTVDTITQESLGNARILVLINMNRICTKNEKQLIWEFVNKGGSLLVLGDHTGVDHIRKPFNDLLSPVKISFNFDSAISLIHIWNHAIEIKPHYIDKNIKDESNLQIGIGASLSITNPARPVIVGKYGFSDSGDMKAENRGYLGDMRYSQGEKLGDLILAAESNYGEGKVLVFGDTSSFQNGALVQSSQFVDRVFIWLNSLEKISYPYDRYLLTILILLVVILLGTQKTYAKSIMIFLINLCVIALLVMVIKQPFNVAQQEEIEAKIAYIDISHFERINLDSWGKPDGFGGLTYNLIRNGYYPKVLKTFDAPKILGAELIIIIAPAKPFTERELKLIEKFVQRGGSLILTVGWEEKTGCKKLLQYFGLDISNIPLGKVSPSQNLQKITFYEAWPVVYEQEDTEALCYVWDYPVVVYKRYFKGGILLVGDSSFLHNINIEGLYDYSISNIMFLKKVISEKFKAGDTIS